jgi:hypothetical protein
VIQAKFVYGSGPTTFIPTFPPVQKVWLPTKRAIRHDDYTGDGLGQWVTDRVDKFITLQFDTAVIGDASAWDAFTDWILEGNIFDYYPDSTSGTHKTYTLEDTDFDPKVNFKSSGGNVLKFTFVFREFVS